MDYKVLIVEDDEDTAVIEAISLKKIGFIVETVGDGNLAIPKMKEFKPNVVILDLELPGKNGLEILQLMFLDPELRDLIIIANTVHMDAKDDLGFSYYAHFQKIKNKEPVMINKLAKDENRHMDLRFVIAQMIGEKFGKVPKKLADWIRRKEGDALHAEN